MVSNLRTIRLSGPSAPQVTVDEMVTPARFKGFGSPNGKISAAIGQEYVDQSTNIEWTKISNDGETIGWVASELLDLFTDRLLEMAADGAYQFITAAFDSGRVITTATVLWPDGSAGVYTTVTKNSTWNAVDAYTVTHTDSGKTITQSTVTRDSVGNVTHKPALTIA